MARQAQPPQVDFTAVKNLVGGTLLWVAMALLVIIIAVILSIRVGQVQSTEVGLLLNRLSGDIEVINQSGVRIYNGITNEFYTLDKTLQTLEIKIQYKLDPTLAKEVLLTSGPVGAFKDKWARDYSRSICRDALGELTTEEFYDAAKRDQKVSAARKKANDLLKDFGIIIDKIVTPKRPRFYAQYEQLIKDKKLADQAVLQEKSRAKEAFQEQAAHVVKETNLKNVAIRQFQGKMDQQIIQAKADAIRAKQEADAYFDEVTIGAEASFYRMEKEATAILARKKAEATGIEALKKALEGEGGRNMVKLEYARKLKGLQIEGKPFIIDGSTKRFERLDAAASSRK
ncbi:MAG: SPFH domain-containing protein [Planctomycetota bacterium]|jgi:hypothetical protein